jgi:hypothetical protein
VNTQSEPLQEALSPIEFSFIDFEYNLKSLLSTKPISQCNA